MPSSLVPPKQLLGGSDATTGGDKEAGSKPSHSSAEGVWASNAAFVVVSALIGSVQVPMPEHPPSHPEKTAPAPAVAVRVTACENVATQFEPQSIPAGEEVTVPFPETCTIRVWGCGPVELP